MSQGLLSGSGSSDILSQALFQTGLSEPVKTECAETPGLDFLEEDLLSCDVQTLTNNLISKMEDNPAQETQLPSSGGTQATFVSQNQPPEDLLGYRGVKDTHPVMSESTSGYTGGVAMPKLRKMENGIVPPPQQQQTFPIMPPQQPNPSPLAGHQTNQPPLSRQAQQQDMYSPSNNSSMEFGGGVDVELEELLTIDVTDAPDIRMYNGSGNTPAPSMNVSSQQQSGYATFPASNTPAQPPYPPAMHTQYSNTYQQSPANQMSPSSQLPELMNDDLFDILGEDLMSLPGQSSYSPQAQSPTHNQYGGSSMPYASAPIMSGMPPRHMTTPSYPSSPGSVTGFNIRQHQQVGGSVGGRGMLPQQLQRVLGRSGGPPNRFPLRTSVATTSNLTRQVPAVSTEPQVSLVVSSQSTKN